MHMPSREERETLSELSRGLSHPVRVEIIRMLAHKLPDRPCICSDIVSALPLAQSTVSQHLKVLRETGWIIGVNKGPCVCYCLAEGVIDLYEDLLEKVITLKATMAIEGHAGMADMPGQMLYIKGEDNARSD